MKKFRVLSLTLAGMLMLSGCHIRYSEDTTKETETTTKVEEKVINFAYTDDSYTSYFEYCKEAYEKANEGVTVNLDLMSADNYLETINSNSTSNSRVEDVYMLENNDIGTAYLAGLASKNSNADFTTQGYCQTALNACSYNGNLVAYPLGYKTVFLAYNTAITGKNDVSTIEKIKDFSADADLTVKAASKVQTIFSANLTDLFMNYGFFGQAFQIGGPYGDDNTVFSVNNSASKTAATNYVSLIDYFSINKKTSYSTVLKNFIAGKSVVTLLSTDSLKSLESAKIKYTTAAFPDYSDKDKTAPLSVTTALLVNPYTSQKETAEDFAWFATYAKAVVLFDYTGTLSAKKGIADDYGFENIYASYEKSVPKNKLLYGEQAYPLLEIALHNIVAGEDSAAELKKVDSYMQEQLK